MRTKTIRLKRRKVEVPEANVYEVIAADEMDARIMAFMLDGGLPSDTEEFDASYIELVRQYTKILEESSA